MIGRSRRACLATLAILLHAGIASADDPTRQEDQLAQTLFEEANTLMDESKFEEACPKFAESQRLAPAGGTLLNLAFCLEKLHKYASAYTAYNEALSAALKDGRKDRETSARERLAEVIPKLSRVAIRVPAEVRDLAELDVRFDGTTVREAAWGVAAPVDPGPHEVIATARGKKPWKLALQVDAEGRTVEVNVGPMVEQPPEVVPQKIIVATPVHDPSLDSRRTASYVIAGVSAAFLVEGIITGALALGAHGEHNDLCVMNGGCNKAATDAESRANALAWAANIGIGGAIIGGVAAGVLFFTSRKPAPPKSSATTIVWTGAGFKF